MLSLLSNCLLPPHAPNSPQSVSNFPNFIFFCKVAFFVRCLAVCFANNPHFYGQAVCLLKLIISQLIRSKGWTSWYPYSDV